MIQTNKLKKKTGKNIKDMDKLTRKRTERKQYRHIDKKQYGMK